MKKIGLKLGSETATAILLEKEAPNVCKAIWAVLPAEAPVHHAKICNHELIFPLPITNLILGGGSWWTENSKIPVPGDIAWWPTRNCINIWYGECIPLGETDIFAKIIDNLAGFGKEARKTWIEPGIHVKMWRMEG